MTQMMIDYRNDNGAFVRKTIDNNEFCVRDEYAYFMSDGERIRVPLQNMSQVYTY